MSNSVAKRQEVRDRIKASGSRTKYIYAEMKRLGFWDSGMPDFKIVEELFEKEAHLQGELRKLLIEKKRIEDPEALLKEIHKKRKEESKKRQKETKERREAERQQKAADWDRKKKEEIVFVGSGYSNTLNDGSSNEDLLKQQQLPVLSDARDLAQAMGISVGELRFLAFSRKNSSVSHYKRFTIPKRSGGLRTISAPMPRLKAAQHWILHNILDKIAVHESAQGCVTGRSIKTNAEKHLAKDLLVNQDLKNFFPSITYKRIRGVFASFGYSKQVATIMAMLCSEPKIKEVEVYSKEYFAQYGERFLPQGSPCSPALTNILCRNLDKRLFGLAKKYDFTYTRYVDDLSFSASGQAKESLNKILLYSRKVIEAEGLELNPEKLRVMRKGRRQHVTGVLVNEKPNVDKKTLKRFRALIYQIERDGIEDKEWKGLKGKKMLSSIHGYASFVTQINPSVGEPYKARVNDILKQYNYTPHNPFAKKKTAESSSKESFSFKKIFSKLFGTKK